MATLFDQQIDLTYEGLIKTTDNAALGATEKEITDGVGTASTLKLGTTSASFVGTLDLTGATVTGLPVAASGLVSGAGTDSMKSADTLTPGATNLAGGQNAIVFGAGAIGNQDYGITIGTYAQSGIFSTTIGTYADGSGLYCTAVGPSSIANADGAVGVGQSSQGLSEGSISLGRSSLVDSTSTGGIAIGDSAEVASAATYAVALGAGVIAATADTVSVKALETQTASTPTAGGVIMTDAGSVARRLNIDAAGVLQVDSTPVGGGGAAGLVSGAGTDSMISASSLTTNAASGAGANAISLGDGAVAGSIGGIAIGKSANTGTSIDYDRSNMSIGNNSSATSEGSLAVGKNATASGDRTVSAGLDSSATSSRAVAVGVSTAANAFASVCIGNYSTVSGESGISIGGYNNSVSGTRGIVLGRESISSATDAVAIGYQVTASTVDTVTIKKLQMLDYASLDYADDTAAATGGIPLGGVYHTSGALKIRIV